MQENDKRSVFDVIGRIENAILTAEDVAELLSTGAKDQAMAMRWIHEAEETNGDNDYLAWTLGLPYQYFRKAA